MIGQQLLRVAAIQMVSSNVISDNMAMAEQLIGDAVKNNAAQIIVLPEYWPFMGCRASDMLLYREAFGNGPLQYFLQSMASFHNVCIIGGTIPLCANDHNKYRNALLAYAPDGTVWARYDKIHLFSYSKGKESYNEGKYIEAGDWSEVMFTPWGRIGLSICYDLRFPEFFRAMSFPDIIVCVAAFTYETGKDHWKLLLRARAVENQCWVIAAGQGGQHGNGRRTWGHSMIVDPWGNIVSEANEGCGIVVADVDFGRTNEIRHKLPAYKHRIIM